MNKVLWTLFLWASVVLWSQNTKAQSIDVEKSIISVCRQAESIVDYWKIDVAVNDKVLKVFKWNWVNKLEISFFNKDNIKIGDFVWKWDENVCDFELADLPWLYRVTINRRIFYPFRFRR